jgi:hypothetical protein
MRADVMKYAGDGAADLVIEAFRRIDVHWTTRILTGFVVDGIMGCKGTAQGHEGFPFITHQMGAGIDGFRENPIRFGLG